MSDLDRLTTDESVINALRRSASIYARRHNLDEHTFARVVQAIVAAEGVTESLPEWVSGGPVTASAQTGQIARRALEAMLNSPPQEGLHAAAADAIAEELKGRGQSLVLEAGGVLLALAILSKWSWSRQDGHRFETGFPGLDGILDKVGKILANLK